jgi:hypothetical protein
MRAADFISVTLCVGAVVASFSLWRGDAGGVAMAMIQSASGSSVPVSLDDQRTLTIDGPSGVTRIEVSHGRARIAASPCHDQRCVLAGWLSEPGTAVVCLPNRVSLTLTGTPDGYDAISF